LIIAHWSLIKPNRRNTIMSLSIGEVAAITAASVAAATATAINALRGDCGCSGKAKAKKPDTTDSYTGNVIYDRTGEIADALLKNEQAQGGDIKLTTIACGATTASARLAAVRAGDADCTDAIRVHNGETYGCVQMSYGLHCVSLMDALV
jgi:ABC-type glycerol-3-phosphate transport system substrate-binding protein